MLETLLILLVSLQLKHLIIDWIWQPEYEWKNKGTYGHWGGILHSGKNAVGTALCFSPFVSWPMVLLVLAIDFLIHYHVDYAKMNINRIRCWGPITHPQFWWLTGVDQFLHQCCYLGLIWLAWPR